LIPSEIKICGGNSNHDELLTVQQQLPADKPGQHPNAAAKPVADLQPLRNPTWKSALPSNAPVADAFQQRKELQLPANLRMLRHTAASQIRVPAADGRKLVDLRALLAPLAEIAGAGLKWLSSCLGAVPDR